MRRRAERLTEPYFQLPVVSPRVTFGFLNHEARANVVLSRGRLGLAILEDSILCSSKDGPLLKILLHICSHPTACTLVGF